MSILPLQFHTYIINPYVYSVTDTEVNCCKVWLVKMASFDFMACDVKPFHVLSPLQRHGLEGVNLTSSMQIDKDIMTYEENIQDIGGGS